MLSASDDGANLQPNFLFEPPPASHTPALMANRMHALYESWARATEQLPRIFLFMVGCVHCARSLF